MTLTAFLLASLPLTVMLQDGTRLHGTASVPGFAALVSNTSTTNLAWKTIRKINATDREAVLVELHGARRLRLRPVATHLAMQTKQLGALDIPWDAIEECRVESVSDDIMWLSAPTATGFGVAPDGVITIQGGRAMTEQLYRLPLTIECELMLLNRTSSSESWLEWALVAPKARRGQPADPASVRLASSLRTKDGLHAGLVLRLMHTAQNTARRPGEPPFALASGVWHRVRIHFGLDRLRVEWNGRPHELQGVSQPNQPVRVALGSSDSQQRWLVRHITIHEQHSATP
ncbi:MAG: hypothetical protein NZ483_04840 [Verrucomicrobiae bacterium]|nr:hypothetical protein [Verrucomicrobiae bacterium]